MTKHRGENQISVRHSIVPRSSGKMGTPVERVPITTTFFYYNVFPPTARSMSRTGADSSHFPSSDCLLVRLRMAYPVAPIPINIKA